MTAPADAEQLVCERAALGALVVGRLTPRDLARDDVPDLLMCAHHRRIVAVLLACYDLRAEGRPVPGKPGVDLRFLLRALAHCGVTPAGWIYDVTWTSGRVTTEALGYVPTLARDAPRRPEALRVLQRLRELQIDRYESEREHVAAVRSLAYLLPASLSALSPADLAAVCAEAQRRRAPREAPTYASAAHGGEAHDPDSFIREHGADGLRAIMADAEAAE